MSQQILKETFMKTITEAYKDVLLSETLNSMILTESNSNFVHPFHGASKKEPTKSHVPLIWETMLGAVNARNPETKEIKYFGHDYDAARNHAGVDSINDLRVAKFKGPRSHNSPSIGQLVLFGVPPKNDPIREHTSSLVD